VTITLDLAKLAFESIDFCSEGFHEYDEIFARKAFGVLFGTHVMTLDCDK